MASAHTVVLLEDEPFFRDLLVRSLAGQDQVHVAASCGNVEEFSSAVMRHRPDVVVTDLVLDPGSRKLGTGLAAAFRARSVVPHCGIVVLSNFAAPTLLARVPSTDLIGLAYLLKGTTSDVEVLLRAIDVAVSGGTMIDPTVTAARPPSDLLTAHEDRVMRMVAAGASNAAIAESLGTTAKSVEHAITGILDALAIDTADRRVNPRVAATLVYLGLT